MPIPIPNLNVANTRKTYVDLEAVTLGGGAGVDWVPTKAPQTSALLVATAGTIKVDTAGGSIGVSFPIPVGVTDLAVTKVYSTTDGTTAVGITALY